MARVLFGVLKGMYGIGGRPRECRIVELRSITGHDRRTIKKAILELARTGWIVASQANQKAPIVFSFANPIWGNVDADLALVRRRIQRAQFRGEALLKEYLTRLVDSDDFEDNASPGFLVNPLTKERMEFDRFYPRHRVAFEFNGAQHYQVTEFTTEEELVKQQVRDLLKIGICVRRKITLITLHPEDLSASLIRQHIGSALPLKEIPSGDPVLRYLEHMSRRYRRASRQ